VPLWLIGMMGSGKSTVGRMLADRADRPFLDTDVLVEAAAGTTLFEIFDAEGEEGFRLRETDAIKAAAGVADAVVATGGGAVLVDQNIRLMKSTGPVVWLQADPATLAVRIGEPSGRPLLSGAGLEERLAAILEERKGAYEAASDHVVSTVDASVDEVVLIVEKVWNASW
jgi:shikimate kinase